MLPGVTVEATSPALIEKVRTVVTDGAGRYSIVDLRPGDYAVTFTLTGFNTFRREGISLTAGFTATVDAAGKEAITVSRHSRGRFCRRHHEIRDRPICEDGLTADLGIGSMPRRSMAARLIASRR